jgi:hypothetical protein
MTGSIQAIVIDDPVLIKIFTGMEIAEIVQLTKENDINKLKDNISKQFYQHFKVKMKILSPSNKKIPLIISVEQIDCKGSITKLLKNIHQNSNLPLIKPKMIP